MIALGVLLIGLLLKSEVIKRVAYGICIFAALSAVPASVSGENAEDTIENIQGIDHNAIHEHEEAAKKFAIVIYLLGIIAAVSLWASWKQQSFATILQFAVLLIGIIAMFFAKKAGTTGGEIRHTEIRVNTTNPNNSNSDNSDREKDHD